MKKKFETQSHRVKGLAFHPIRPWILASLHNGVVQLWDYRIQTLLETYDAHEGPCRGISFHHSQPLFVSGGDDYLVKVWNYKLKKHMFTLTGHLDYIRTTQFHHELPWILSSSDDQTIRIWNYQNRSQLAILTGHSHYVMCAQFHPSKDLIVSCSLDQTLRLWDFSQIRQKYNTNKSSNQQQQQLYGNEVEIIAIMDGHDLGVNWCSFHPTMNLIISSADDRKVKLWKFTETRAWEQDNFYGHSSNVSSCIFHPKLDVVISNSEDKTTRIWNLDRRVQIDMVKRETERYWISAANKENYLFATGHDNGFEIYSLINDKIPQVSLDSNQIVFIYRNQLKLYSYSSNSIKMIKDFEESESQSITMSATSIVHNHFDNSKVQLLIGFNDKKKETMQFQLLTYSNINQTCDAQKSFTGVNATFVSKSKIARLLPSQEVEVYNLELETNSNALPGLTGVQKLFQSPIGKLVALTESSLVIYDINGKKIVQQIPITSDMVSLKQIVWNKSNSFLALISKKNITIMTKNLQKICSFPEKFNIKSFVWGKDNSIYYTTINHIKYGLLNGDSGIFKCTDQTLRIARFEKEELLAIDSTGQVQKIKLNCDEYLLKQALNDRNWEKTQKLLNSMKRQGNSLISYLYKKNYAGLALNMVQDTKAKFSLALNSGNLDIAFEAVNELKDKESYQKFAQEALRQGQLQISQNQPSVERAFRQNKEYDKLVFLYLLAGDSKKLQAMIQIAQKRGDNQSRFQNALYTGDIQERIKMFSEIGQINLAYLTAVVHGQEEMAAQLKQSVENPEELLKEIKEIKSSALVPPQPIIRNIQSSAQAQRNWPLNHIPEEYEVIYKQTSSGKQAAENLIEEQQQGNDLLVDEGYEYQGEQEEDQQQQNNDFNADLEAEGETEWDLNEEVLPEKNNSSNKEEKQAKKDAVQDGYKKQEDLVVKNGRLSQNPGEQVAAGYFELAFQNLKKQMGVVHFEPLKEICMKIATSAQTCVPQTPFLQNTMSLIHQDKKPFIFISIKQLSQLIQQKAYKLFSKGPSQFAEAQKTFLEILYSVLFLKISDQNELQQIQSLIKICQSYILAIKLQLNTKKQSSRASELMAYMALIKLQNPHREITLRQAQSALFKEKNYIYASYFATKLIRLLENNSSKEEVVNNSRRIFAECEKNGTNQGKQIQLEEGWLYDDDFVYQIDGQKLKIIEGNSVKCPFCQTRYEKNSGAEGRICTICQVAKIGQEVMGLKVSK